MDNLRGCVEKLTNTFFVGNSPDIVDELFVVLSKTTTKCDAIDRGINPFFGGVDTVENHI